MYRFKLFIAFLFAITKLAEKQHESSVETKWFLFFKLRKNWKIGEGLRDAIRIKKLVKSKRYERQHNPPFYFAV